MNIPPDLASIGGTAIAELIKSSFNSIVGYGAEKANKVYIKVFEDFKPYMEECYKRNRFVRILCQDDDDVDLLSVYVQTHFRNKTKQYTDQEISYEISEGSNVVITGPGGAGKTFFMRKLWLDYLAGQLKTPIFIEFKKIGDLSSVNLEAFIRLSLSKNLPEDVFREMLQEGRIILILDGFDELPREVLPEVQRQVIALAETYPNCKIAVSSRPDSRFSGWSSFKVFEADPLKIEQTRELCRKVPFDSEYQKVFVKGLTEEFYNKYKSFLSNPLLTIMMMMTFKRNMNISRKMGVFYDEAFSTLYQWHDATKAYSRVKNLDIQQFRKMFGAFCLLSYAREKFDFSRTEIDELIEQSGKLVGIDIAKDLVLDDFERNVNLIRQDGLRYYFIHRSFQEYFAAWALVNLFPQKIGSFSDKLGLRASDSVLSMCYDLHRTLVVQNYVKPKYESFRKSLSLGTRMPDEALWGVLQGGILIIASKRKSTDKAKGGFEGFGFGFHMEKDFRAFFRCVQRMQLPDEGSGPDYFITGAIINHDMSKRMQGLLDRAVKELKAPSKDDHYEFRIFPDPRMKQATVSIDCGSLAETSSECKGAIQLTDDESLFFKQLASSVSPRIREAAKWCESEINFARQSDSQVDEFFSAD